MHGCRRAARPCVVLTDATGTQITELMQERTVFTSHPDPRCCPSLAARRPSRLWWTTGRGGSSTRGRGSGRSSSTMDRRLDHTWRRRWKPARGRRRRNSSRGLALTVGRVRGALQTVVTASALCLPPPPSLLLYNTSWPNISLLRAHFKPLTHTSLCIHVRLGLHFLTTPRLSSPHTHA